MNHLRYYLCSSYSRIQLFRLKGAQRKLKTDRSKIERLTPSDLRKRYQISSKVTVFYNSPFDPLYSTLLPTGSGSSGSGSSATPSITNGLAPATSSFQTVTPTPLTASTNASSPPLASTATTTGNTSSFDQSYYQSHYGGVVGGSEFACIPPPSDSLYGGVYSSSLNGFLPSSSQQTAPSNSYVDHGLITGSGVNSGHFNPNDSIGDHYYGTCTYENYSNMNFR
jgi:hypothetical protein